MRNPNVSQSHINTRVLVIRINFSFLRYFKRCLIVFRVNPVTDTKTFTLLGKEPLLVAFFSLSHVHTALRAALSLAMQVAKPLGINNFWLSLDK